LDSAERNHGEVLRQDGISPARTENSMSRIGRLLGGILSALILAGVSEHASCMPDYAREARLADEVVPAIVVGDPVYLSTPAQPRILAIFTQATPPAIAKAAAIVVHGSGVHPDWGLNNGLRTGLAESGIATLSVQMPVLSADASNEQYEALFPEARGRLDAALNFLRDRGFERIAIVSHSMGASMVDAYLAFPSAAKIAAWVPIGMTHGFSANPSMPVLDIAAERDLPQVLRSAAKRAAALSPDTCSKHISITGADHLMEHQQRELVAVIVPFLARAFAGRC
jgi:pimeloyl-ACP methyl ester carboxylesterase